MTGSPPDALHRGVGTGKERNPRTRALLVVHTVTWFTEMFRVAAMLRDRGSTEPIVFFAMAYPALSRDQNRCRDAGIRFLGREAFQETKPFTKDVNSFFSFTAARFFHLAARCCRRLSRMYEPLSRIAGQLTSILVNRANIRALLRSESISIVILAGDLVGYDTAEFVREARQERIPVLIAPSTMSDGTEQAEVYFNNPTHQVSGFINRSAAFFFPKWRKVHRGKELLRLDGTTVFAREISGLSVPLPWVSSSTRADGILVESRYMYDYYERCGIKPDKLILCGSSAHDIMADVTRDRAKHLETLFRELKFEKHNPILLSALIPDCHYMLGAGQKSDFPTYAELLRFWIDSLARAAEYNVVINLHPSVDIRDFEDVLGHDVRVSQRDILELIPLCSLYVASVSSTIRWALASGKPVVNYDVYRFRYADYQKAHGVIAVEEKSDFTDALENLKPGGPLLESLRTQAEQQAPYWGNLDGKEGERIFGTINGYLKRSAAA